MTISKYFSPFSARFILPNNIPEKYNRVMHQFLVVSVCPSSVVFPSPCDALFIILFHVWVTLCHVSCKAVTCCPSITSKTSTQWPVRFPSLAPYHPSLPRYFYHNVFNHLLSRVLICVKQYEIESLPVASRPILFSFTSFLSSPRSFPLRQWWLIA